MKKWLILVLLAMLALSWTAMGEETTITFQKKITVSLDAEYVDFGDEKAKKLEDLEAFLLQLPKLKKVDMFATPVNAKQIAELENKFPQVEFGWTMTIACRNPLHPERKYHYIRTDATAFSTLHNNQCMQHSSADFQILKYCKNLLALDIGHNAVDSLDFLQYLPKLRVLIIGRNRVKDLWPLAGCPELEYLEAFSNQIESVEPLLSCTHLMDLNIPNNKVRDPELFARMTWLKRLWAFNYAWNDTAKSHVPGAVRNLIAGALPNCKINWTQSGTGGWREHKHYNVISEMFNSGVYLPFADSFPLN